MIKLYRMSEISREVREAKDSSESLASRTSLDISDITIGLEHCISSQKH